MKLLVHQVRHDLNWLDELRAQIACCGNSVNMMFSFCAFLGVMLVPEMVCNLSGNYTIVLKESFNFSVAFCQQFCYSRKPIDNNGCPLWASEVSPFLIFFSMFLF